MPSMKVIPPGLDFSSLKVALPEDPARKEMEQMKPAYNARTTTSPRHTKHTSDDLPDTSKCKSFDQHLFTAHHHAMAGSSIRLRPHPIPPPPSKNQSVDSLSRNAFGQKLWVARECTCSLHHLMLRLLRGLGVSQHGHKNRRSLSPFSLRMLCAATSSGGSPMAQEKKERPPVRVDSSFRQDTSDPEIWKVALATIL